MNTVYDCDCAACVARVRELQVNAVPCFLAPLTQWEMRMLVHAWTDPNPWVLVNLTDSERGRLYWLKLSGADPSEARVCKPPDAAGRRLREGAVARYMRGER